VHKFCELYKNFYLLSSKISKRDKFGIWSKIENICLDAINLSIAAALEPSTNKLPLLNSIRIKIEILKRLIRICKELNIVNDKNYINIESNLQEISKMANGWIKYLLKKSR
jgi:hypothetical protein